MKKHIEKHCLTYLMVSCILLFNILFPDFYILIEGGLAWISFIISIVVGLMMIYCCIFGGSLSFKSEGLIPKIKRWRGKKE